MSASLKSKPANASSRRKQLAADRRRQVAADRFARQEAADENLAPAVQRHSILGRDGTVLRGARVERSGCGFIKSSPIQHLVARGRNKDFPLLSKRHSDAASRLAVAWQEGSDGVTMGVSSYEQRSSSTPQTGFLADGVIRGVHRQMAARAEIEAVRARVGPLWPALYNVAILNLDVAEWSTAIKMNPEQAAGFLAASLDMLVSFYADAEPERRGRIRTVTVSGLAPVAAE